jgi:hypothetical protein
LANGHNKLYIMAVLNLQSGRGSLRRQSNTGPILLPAGVAVWNKGFNFRSTLGFVADASNEQFVNESFGAYPQSVTIGGDVVVCGWETAPSVSSSRDRNAGIDSRLAGIIYTASGSGIVPVFRVDLPATGNYEITIATGDAGNSNSAFFTVKDNTTVLISRTEVSTANEEFVDASLVTRTSAANWVANQVAVTKTFASTIFRFTVLEPTGSASVLAHINIRKL